MGLLYEPADRVLGVLVSWWFWSSIVFSDRLSCLSYQECFSITTLRTTYHESLNLLVC